MDDKLKCLSSGRFTKSASKESICDGQFKFWNTFILPKTPEDCRLEVTKLLSSSSSSPIIDMVV